MYKPANGSGRRELVYRALVNAVDPDRERAKHHELEYTMSRRNFYGDPERRGAYNNFLNVYRVGRPHG